MKKLFLLLLLSIIGKSLVKAQTPYTTEQFTIDSFLNVSYGIATDYAGNPDTLKMDIYRPHGDANCQRPIAVLVHGGAWVAGSKEDYDLIYLSKALAKRGWVVATINYRLGTHKAANYSMYALCNTSLAAPCAYICDSAEIIRANYRGMQDTKGAIRFMKNRSALDSSDVNNVFVVGQSAGAFIALATTFTDLPSEKPASCFAIANAPTPDPDLITYACIPSSNDLSRPDLGSIDGDLNLGSYDASVKGVGSFYGAMFDLNTIPNSSNNPCVYLFHQGSDVVVNYQYGQVLGRVSWECFAQTNLCQSFYFYPFAHGGAAIQSHFTTMSNPPVFQADIVANYNYMNNCLSNGHAIDNIALRTQNMVDLFAARIALNGNTPQSNCTVGINQNQAPESSFTLYPNIINATTPLQINSNQPEANYFIYDALGRLQQFGKIHAAQTKVDLQALPQGMYVIRLSNGNQAQRFFKQ